MYGAAVDDDDDVQSDQISSSCNDEPVPVPVRFPAVPRNVPVWSDDADVADDGLPEVRRVSDDDDYGGGGGSGGPRDAAVECSSSSSSAEPCFRASGGGGGDGPDQSPESSFMTYSGRRHKIYTEEFKTHAVRKSRGTSFKAAAGALKIDPKTLAAWKKCARGQEGGEEDGGDAEGDVIRWLSDLGRTGTPVDAKTVSEKLSSFSDVIGKNCDKKGWFVEWVAKVAPAAVGAEFGLFPLDSRVQFPYKFKAVVARLAQNQSHASLSKAVAVSRKQIAAWVKNRDSFVLESGRDGDRTGQRCGVEGVKHEKAEKQLFAWYAEEKSRTGQHPKYAEVKRRAKTLFSANGFPRLKCSYGWFTRWKARYSVETLRHPGDAPLVAWVLAQYDLNAGLTLAGFLRGGAAVLAEAEVGTGIATNKVGGGELLAKDWAVGFAKRNAKHLQFPGHCGSASAKLPEVLERSFDDFRGELVKMKGLYGLKNIGNVDEIFLTISVDSGEKTSLIPSSGPMGSALGTVIFSCLATGQVLPPLLVLNGGSDCAEDIQNGGVVDGCIVVLSAEGTVCRRVLKQWLSEVWLKHAEAPSLLLLDAYPCHGDEQWRDACNDEGVTVMQFPLGTAGFKQPIDVCVKRVFMERFRSELLSAPPPGRQTASKIDRICHAVNAALRAVVNEKQDLLSLTFEQLCNP